jgi:hypothetical protein
LWIKDDQVVGVGPFVIPGMPDVAVGDRVMILLAAMQRDMDPAGLQGGAGRGYIDVTGFGQAVGGR